MTIHAVLSKVKNTMGDHESNRVLLRDKKSLCSSRCHINDLKLQMFRFVNEVTALAIRTQPTAVICSAHLSLVEAVARDMAEFMRAVGVLQRQ